MTKGRALLCFLLASIGGCKQERETTYPVIADTLTEAARIEAVEPQPVCDLHEERCLYTRIEVATGLSNSHTIIGNSFEVLGEFDSTGVFVRNVGKRGSGLGEYRAVAALSSGPNNSVIVLDVAGMKIEEYDSLGANLKSMRVDASPVMLFGGIKLVGAALFGLSSPLAKSTKDTVTGAIRKITSPNGAAEITKVEMPAVVVGENARSVPSLFLQKPHWGVDDEGMIVLAPSAKYRIKRLDGAGKTITDFGLAVPVLPVTESDIKIGVARLAKGLPARARASAGSYLQEARENAAKTFPAISDVFVLRDGTFWVQRAASLTADSARWDHFSSRSVLDGYMMLPREARVLAAQGGRLLLVTKDSMDVDKAAWYRLQGRLFDK